MEARDYVTAIRDFGLTQAQIAERTGIPQPTISKIERGDVADVMSRNYRALQALLSELQGTQPVSLPAAVSVAISTPFEEDLDEILPPEKTVPRVVVADRAAAPGSDFEPLPTQVDRREPDAPIDRRAWDADVAEQERVLAMAKPKAGQGG